MADPDDPEIRDFVLASPLPTYTDIAAEVVRRFGDRAWPVEMIRAAKAAVPRDRRSRFRRDPAVMAYIADHADLIQLDRILDGGRTQFGHHRFPSRSQLHRLISEMRPQASQAHSGSMG